MIENQELFNIIYWKSQTILLESLVQLSHALGIRVDTLLFQLCRTISTILSNIMWRGLDNQRPVYKHGYMLKHPCYNHTPPRLHNYVEESRLKNYSNSSYHASISRRERKYGQEQVQLQ